VRLRARKPSNPAYPRELRTLGDHLRRRRLDLGLLQREAAARIGCSVSAVNNWERNRTQPKMTLVPAILAFLGYVPLETPDDPAPIASLSPDPNSRPLVPPGSSR
jgi:transcriptional regulator with XRE-family HTH domain